MIFAVGGDGRGGSSLDNMMMMRSVWLTIIRITKASVLCETSRYFFSGSVWSRLDRLHGMYGIASPTYSSRSHRVNPRLLQSPAKAI